MPEQYVKPTETFSALALARQALNEHRPHTAAQLYRLVNCFWPDLQRVQTTRDIILPHRQPTLPALTVLIWCDSTSALSHKLLQLSAQPYPVQQVILYASSIDMQAALSLMLSKMKTALTVTVATDVAGSLNLMWQQYVVKGITDGQMSLAITLDAPLEPVDFYQLIARELYSPASCLTQFKDTLGAETTINGHTLPPLALVLTLNSTLNNEDLTVALAWLSQHFSLKVYLTAASPEWVFDNIFVMRLLESGLIERLQITDQQQFFARDSIEFIKKLSSQSLYLCNAAQCARHIFALYRFYHQATQNILDPYEIVACLSSSNAGLLFSDDAIPSSFLVSLFGFPNVAASACGFSTSTAVARLGGFPAYSRLPLCYGSVSFGDIEQWWLLSNSHTERAAKLRTIPLELALTEQRCLLFDLQPAVVCEDAQSDLLCGDYTRLRRWLLTARVMPVMHTPKALPPARFLMTNYNKAPFLADSLYSVVLQTYRDCHVLVMDDASSDNSLDVLVALQRWLPPNFIEISSGSGKEGTYRLRNRAISTYVDSDTLYLVNDADDFSTARRAELQSAFLFEQGLLYTFADIIRVNVQGEVLTLDGVVERYGTASFCAAAAIHKKYGYYENLRKGADTEFIERLTRFAPKALGRWWRYPLLFQSFDGNNLTNDIYTVTHDGALAQDISSRSPYIALFRTRHNKLLTDWLPQRFSADNSEFPAAYLTTLPDFFMPAAKVTATDDSTVLQQFTAQMLHQAGFEPLPAGVSLAFQQQALVVTTELASESHAYLMLKQRFSPQQFQSNQFNSVALYFEVAQQLGISACLIYQDEQGQQISHQFFWANQLMPVKLAANCYQVQLGFRLQGSGTATISMLEVHAR